MYVSISKVERGEVMERGLQLIMISMTMLLTIDAWDKVAPERPAFGIGGPIFRNKCCAEP